MRMLMLSLDKKIFENGSAVQRRLIALAEKAGGITVFVPDVQNERREVSPHLKVHGFSGGKIVQLWKMWGKGKKILNEHHPLSISPSKEGERRRGYDLITVQDTTYLAVLAYLLAKKFGLPFEVQVHGFEKMRRVRKLIAGFVLRRAERVRVVSERLKKQLTTNYQLPTTKLYVLSVYTQHPSSILPSKEGRRQGEPFTFLTVGRLVPVKNVALQIRAFARLTKEYPQVRLRIVGDGPLLGSLELKVKSLELEDTIQFLGQQNNTAPFYEEADAFLLTSDTEGWGLAVTEAAGYGLPIIMTDVGLAVEFIKNEESGLVISVGDEDALVAAMRRIIGDAEMRARLGAAARRSFLALPSAEEQIRKQVEEWKGFR